MSDTKSEAVALAKEKRSDSDVIVKRFGVRGRIVGMSSAINDDVIMRIKDPDVPMWHNPDKGRDEPNAADPDYLRELQDAKNLRSLARVEAMAMFGIELLDGLPESDDWLNKLKFMEKRGHIDLSAYDLSDPVELEFVFKRYVFMHPGDVLVIGRKMNLSPEEIRQAEDTF